MPRVLRGGGGRRRADRKAPLRRLHGIQVGAAREPLTLHLWSAQAFHRDETRPDS